MKKFAVLIPAYHPQRQLIGYVSQLVKEGAAKVVVVDDGSGEGSRPIFQAIHDLPQVDVLSYPKNHGKGYALKIGMAYLNRRCPDIEGLVTADADGQHLVEDVIRLGEFMLQYPCDYILGMRDFKTDNVPDRSYVGNRLTSRVFFFLFHRYYADTQTGLRGIRRSELPALLNIPGHDFDFEMNMLVYMTTHRKRVVRYDITTVYEEDHRSHYRTVRDSLKIAHPLIVLHSNWMRELVRGHRRELKKDSYGTLFRFTRFIGRMFLPQYRYHVPAGLDFDRPTVFVSHHQNMLGPVAIMLWLSEDIILRLWGLDVFAKQQDAYDHYMSYTLTDRFGLPKTLAHLLACPLSYYVAHLFDSAGAVAVHRQSREIIHTLKESVQLLSKGQSLLIFPDIDYSSDQQRMGSIYQGFLHLEKYYRRAHDQSIQFVPLFADDEAKRIRFGKPLSFDADRSFIDQREEVAQRIQDSLNHLASDKNKKV